MKPLKFLLMIALVLTSSLKSFAQLSTELTTKSLKFNDSDTLKSRVVFENSNSSLSIINTATNGSLFIHSLNGGIFLRGKAGAAINLYESGNLGLFGDTEIDGALTTHGKISLKGIRDTIEFSKNALIREDGFNLIIENKRDINAGNFIINEDVVLKSRDGVSIKTGATGKERLRVAQDGNIAIGDENGNPDFTLDINHGQGNPSSSSDNGLNLRNVALNNHQWQFYVAGTSGNLSLFKNRNIRGSFNDASGNYVASSDRRLKKNITTLKKQLPILRRLRPTSYQFKDREGKQRVYGLIAQEVQKVIPDIVYEVDSDSENPVLGISYTEFIPVLIAGLQEQLHLIDDQEQQIEKQQRQSDKQAEQIQQMKKELADLKALVQIIAKTPNMLLEGNAQASMDQNIPNPFQQSTHINYFLPHHIQSAYIQITGTNGQLLKSIKLEGTGTGQITINTQDLPNGQYYYSLLLDNQLFATKQMVLQH